VSREVHAPFCEQHLGRLRVLTLPINTLAVMVKTGFDMDVVEDICFYFEVAVPPKRSSPEVDGVNCFALTK